MKCILPLENVEHLKPTAGWGQVQAHLWMNFSDYDVVIFAQVFYELLQSSTMCGNVVSLSHLLLMIWIAIQDSSLSL